MKNIAIILIVLMLSGCTTSTQFGPCIGLGEDRNPALVYKLDIWNLIMGIIFIEMIIPPVVIAVDETFCPVGVK